MKNSTTKPNNALLLSSFFKSAWRHACGLPQERYMKPPSKWRGERFWNFIHAQARRLDVGVMRYEGKAKEKECEKLIIRKINKFRQTGNGELLVDVANLCLLMYVNSESEIITEERQ